MDFFAIGDTVIDTFIRITEAEVRCDEHNEHCMLSMRFGDKIPFEFAKTLPAVGNSPNAAVAAARLGLSSALFAAVGKDRGGEDCLAALKQEGVDETLIAVEEGKETNHHYVLWYGPERTILIKHESFEYHLPSPMPTPRAVYLSSIGEAGMFLHEPLADWFEQHPEMMLAFQPGTYQIAAGLEKLARIYARTNIFIANKEEYQHILSSNEESEKRLMELMREKGPKICFLTDGPNGAYTLSDDGAWKIGLARPDEEAYERTGAGDAFAATAVAALLLGKSVPEALTWGPINSASVVMKVGAQEGLLTRAALEEQLKNAPASYSPVLF